MISVVKELIIFNLIPILVFLFFINDSLVRKSIFIAWLIASMAIGIGLLSFQLAKNKSNKVFMKFYFGGMITRLLSSLAIIFATLKFIGINLTSFLFSLFIFYIINQTLELRHIIRSQTNK